MKMVVYYREFWNILQQEIKQSLFEGYDRCMPRMDWIALQVCYVDCMFTYITVTALVFFFTLSNIRIKGFCTLVG